MCKVETSHKGYDLIMNTSEKNETARTKNHTELAEARHGRGLRLRTGFANRIPGFATRFLNRDAVGLGGHGQIELHGGGVLIPGNSDAITHDGSV